MANDLVESLMRYSSLKNSQALMRRGLDGDLKLINWDEFVQIFLHVPPSGRVSVGEDIFRELLEQADNLEPDFRPIVTAANYADILQYVRRHHLQESDKDPYVVEFFTLEEALVKLMRRYFSLRHELVENNLLTTVTQVAPALVATLLAAMSYCRYMRFHPQWGHRLDLLKLAEALRTGKGFAACYEEAFSTISRD
mgnify:CR=1 FL=1